MGLLVDGIWHDRWYDTAASGGRFVRSASRFRHWITPDGRPGPSGDGGFRAAAGRYHLYISHACPWAHRTAIFRVIKGLEELVSLSVVHWHMGAEGWTFQPGDGVIADPIHQARCLHSVYTRADPHYSGRVTVPVLWDRESGRIVNNESADIIRMFNSAFEAVGAAPGDFYPEPLRSEIDALNQRIYDTVNNGVYRCGFATSQSAYDEAIGPLFATLDALEERLADQPFLLGSTLTEADWRLFTTLVRFDAVYVGHFKCNLRRLIDYPHLWRYVRQLYRVPGVAGTVNLHHIKAHYYQSHPTINPSGVVPAGPLLSFA
ncbi:glutathione S-transferase family protein [Cyanobium sp. NIES-981]|uniref:glutathione S-transferase family protein n=1 Tax=Cyanobium sp. NIES-981 TaxID=1851505 RepID=UPI000B353E8B|nr:glutathione S-transferase family protein [Cyanobium sp. NIES-981]